MEYSSQECEVIEKCPFFNSLQYDSTANTLKLLFCKADWQKCQRWKLRTSGADVPVNMWPNGFLSQRTT
jgi:hypothetical protein